MDYVYDLLGNLRQTRLPNGVVSDYVYDPLNRLLTLRHFHDDDGDGSLDQDEDLLASYAYSLLADGRRSGVTEMIDHDNDPLTPLVETRIDWFYDNLGRLTRESYNYDLNAADDNLVRDEDYITDYVLDLVGNRMLMLTDTIPDFDGDPVWREKTNYLGYNPDDHQVVEYFDADNDGTTDQTTVYLYGGLGSQSQLLRKSVVGVSRMTYQYDLQGRMSQTDISTDANTDAEQRITYTYDADGIRTGQLDVTDVDNDGSFDDETATATSYFYDKHNPTGYAQILEETATTGASSVRKTYTLGNDVVAQQSSTVESGCPLFLLYDGHGSTRALVDATGQILTAQIFRYDAFGVPLAHYASGVALPPATPLTSLLYSGEQTDPTGLQYLRARYYDPRSGRFTTIDPYRGNLHDPQTLHKYLYCHADPVNGIDPSGMFFGMLGGMAIGLERWGISAQNGLMVMGAVDRLQTMVDIGQVVIQIAATGTVNPMDLADVAFAVLPGSKLLKGIQAFLPPLGRLTSFAGKITGSSTLLNTMARNLDEIGTNLYRNANGSWAKAVTVSRRFVERVGEMGGGFVAKQLGLERVESYVKRGVHGFDGIFKQGDKFFILEAKGGLGTLDRKTGQMGQKWIMENIRKLPGGLGDDLMRAVKENRLFGIVTTTQIDDVAGSILDPEYVIKHFSQIGGNLW